MTNETKVACYKEAYALLQGMEGFTDFEWPEEKTHLDFTCRAGDTKIYFRLFTNGDLASLRAECQKGGDDNENAQQVEEITGKHNGMNGYAYDGVILLNLNIPFPSVADADAKKLVLDKTKEFAQTILTELSSKDGTYEEIGKQRDEAEDVPAVADAVADAFLAAETDLDEKEAPSDVIKKPKKNLEKQVEEKKNAKKPYTAPAISIEPVKPAIPVSDSTLSYSPDVESERQQMYAEMQHTFSIQKKHQDYREGLLNTQKAVLEKERKELEAEKAASKKEKEEVSASSKKLKNKWDNYNSAKRNLDQRIVEFDKKENEQTRKELELTRRENELNDRQEGLNTREKAIEYRERTVSNQEDALAKKIVSISQKEQDLNDKEATLGLQKDRIDMQKEQMEIERNSIASQYDDLKELEQMVKELGGLPVGSEAAVDQDKIDKLEADNNVLRQQCDELKSALNTAKEKKEELERQLKSASEQAVADPVKDEEIAGLRGQLNQREAAVSDLQKQLKESQEASEASEKERKVLEEKNEALEKRIASIKVYDPVDQLLVAAGFQPEAIAGEGDPLISVSSGSCKVYINERLKMACVEKKTRRNYTKTFDTWNSQSFAETYAMSKGKAYCRFAYDDLVADIKRITSKMDTLK